MSTLRKDSIHLNRFGSFLSCSLDKHRVTDNTRTTCIVGQQQHQDPINEIISKRKYGHCQGKKGTRLSLSASHKRFFPPQLLSVSCGKRTAFSVIGKYSPTSIERGNKITGASSTHSHTHTFNWTWIIKMIFVRRSSSPCSLWGGCEERKSPDKWMNELMTKKSLILYGRFWGFTTPRADIFFESIAPVIL